MNIKVGVIVFFAAFPPLHIFITEGCKESNKASQAIRSPRTVLFFLLISLLDGYSFANVHVKGIVTFKHLKKTVTLTSITDL